MEPQQTCLVLHKISFQQDDLSTQVHTVQWDNSIYEATSKQITPGAPFTNMV